jgi:carbon storage regulator
MLLLTRRKGESIIIGNNIEVTLIELKGNQARIGISAPNEVVILREEVYEKIHQQKFNRFKKMRASNDKFVSECAQP